MSRGKPKAAESEAPDPLIAMARAVAEIVAEHNLSELILDTKEVTLTVRRGGIAVPVASTVALAPSFSAGAAPPAPVAGAVASAPAAADDDKAHFVTSPFVGTFYRRPTPESPNSVSVHDKVEKGQVLCIVEAMKLMNEIEADVAGTIVAILVDDGAPVEYGQRLFKIVA